MAKLEGILYKAFERFFIFRGYAPLNILAEVSKRPEAYQRHSDNEHKKEIIRFLLQGEYSYFPELVFAFRGADVTGLLTEFNGHDDVEYSAEQYVPGLKVLKEKVPHSGYRARHAQLSVNPKALLRVDGNHRLEPFDEDITWWESSINETAPEDYNEEQKKAWLRSEATNNRNNARKIIVPFAIVISNSDIADPFEASIFNNINFKQKPLRQEKNIHNIHKFLKDSDELGKPHSLTMKLIDLVESGHFIGLPLLAKQDNDDKDIYRTVCYKTVELLILQQEQIKKTEIPRLEENIQTYQEKLKLLEDEIKEKKESTDKETSEKEKKESLDKETKENRKTDLSNSIAIIEKQIDNINRMIELDNKRKKILENFETAINHERIEIAIQSLRSVYSCFAKRSGNISLFSALVYYKLLDEQVFSCFVDWVLSNKINEIPVNDELPTHNAQSLISLFRKVYEAKGKEVFISMQFGDPQSEMIYEKVVQTIAKVNNKHGLDIKISVIRIDQKTTSDLFNIPQEITRAIETSSLIIADLSSKNVNVYHEIGMAMGLAQAKNIPAPVILLYKTDSSYRGKEVDEDHFVGFNLRSESQLRFTTYKQLVDGLTERLEKHYGLN